MGENEGSAASVALADRDMGINAARITISQQVAFVATWLFIMCSCLQCIYDRMFKKGCIS